MTTISRLAALVMASCLAAVASAAPAAAGGVARRGDVQGVSPSASPAPAPPASAWLTQCVTAGAEGERSLTVAGQMTLVAGSSRMQTRTYLVERRSGEAQFHMIAAPGLGAWLEAEPGVKTYKDLRQVTNLSPGVIYRAVVDFRWLTPRGHIVKRLQLDTPRCAQPAAPAGSTSGASGSKPAQGGS